MNIYFNHEFILTLNSNPTTKSSSGEIVKTPLRMSDSVSELPGFEFLLDPVS